MVKTGIPDLEEGCQHGHIVSGFSATEMLIHCVCAGEELAEIVPAYRDGATESDCGPYGIAASHPVPQGQAVPLRDTEVMGGIQVGGHGKEVAINIPLICTRPPEPFPGRQAVGEGFLGAE